MGMGGPVSKSLHATDFIEKYGKGNLDQDQLTEGFQNDTFTVEQFKTDFNTLNASDKYVVFETYRQADNYELLAAMLGLDKNIFPKSDASLFKNIEDFCEKIHLAASDDKTEADIWETRLMLAQGLFTIDIMTEELQSDGRIFKKMQDLRDNVFNSLKDLYILTKHPAIGKNLYFNTDGDLIMEVGLREFMFDHMDADPYDKEVAVDTDGDTVADQLDLDPSNANEWSGMKVGETLQTKSCDIVRTESGYVIKVKVHLKPADDLIDEEAVKKMLSDPKLLKKLGEDINKYFIEHRGDEAADFDFQVEFVGDGENAHQEVLFSDSPKRSDSEVWRAAALNSPRTMVHELFHKLGQPDYYHEALVDKRVRDKMTAPGSTCIAADNIMETGGRVTQRQMRDIIVKAIHTNQAAESTGDGSDEITADFNSRTYELWYAYLSTDPSLQMAFSADESGRLYNEIKEQLKSKPADPSALVCAAKLAFMLGLETELQGYIKKLEKLKNADEFLFEIFNSFGNHSRAVKPEINDRFLEFNKTRALGNKQMAGIYGRKLLELKKYNEFLIFMDKAGKKFKSPDELPALKAIAKAEKTSIAETITHLRMAAKHASYFDTMAMIEYLLDKGAVKEAGTIGIPKTSKEFFMQALITKGLYDEAIEICQDLIRKDPTDIDSIATLVECYRKKGDFEGMAASFEKLFAVFWIMEHELRLEQKDEKARVFENLALTEDECKKLIPFVKKLPHKIPSIEKNYIGGRYNKECLLYLINKSGRPLIIQNAIRAEDFSTATGEIKPE